MKKIVIVFIGLFYSSCILAQDSIRVDKIWNVELKAGYFFTLADMAERFGNSFTLGGGLKLKNKKNWLFAGNFHFLVGGKVKEPGLLQNVKSTSGDIINQYGELVQPGIFQRGYLIELKAGKILPYLQSNANSGLTVETGLGFIQHKINLFDRDNNMPQIKGEYKKGYDRLSNGWFVKQYVGFTHFASNKLMNYTLGLEGIFAFTQGRRDYWFDVQKAGNDKRNDIMIGLSAAWFIPMYKKNVEEIYY